MFIANSATIIELSLKIFVTYWQFFMKISSFFIVFSNAF